jgi:putative hydrolase of the HAD superfamily
VRWVVTGVRAVLFDLGGTLFSYDAREEMGRANGWALRRMGLDPADPAVVAARRQAGVEIEQEYAARRSFLHRDLFRDRLARTAARLGVVAPDAVLAQFDRDQRAAVIEHLVPRADAVATLLALRARDLHVAVVSNADDDYLEPVLHRNGIAELLDAWTSSEGANSCKPDSRIFEYALAKAGASADLALFVGDSPHHDVAGARAAGLRSVLIGDPDGPAPLSHGLAPASADHVVSELGEVVAIVDTYNGR